MKTAVEWLLDWMGKNQYFIGNDLVEAFSKAKEMEKETKSPVLTTIRKALGNLIKKCSHA